MEIIFDFYCRASHVVSCEYPYLVMNFTISRTLTAIKPTSEPHCKQSYGNMRKAVLGLMWGCANSLSELICKKHTKVDNQFFLKSETCIATQEFHNGSFNTQHTRTFT